MWPSLDANRGKWKFIWRIPPNPNMFHAIQVVTRHVGGGRPVTDILRQWPAGAAGGAGAPPPPPGQRPAGQESTPNGVRIQRCCHGKFYENNAWILRIPSWFLDFCHEFATQFRQNSKCCNKSGCFRLIAASRIDTLPTQMALNQKFLEVGEMIHPELSGLCKVWNPVLLVCQTRDTRTRDSVSDGF